MDRMKDYKQLLKELPSRTVVMAFGRFNPPTIGHELLVKAVKKLAQQKKADHVIYASRSQDAKKNPLSVDKKVKYLKLMFRDTNFVAADDQVRTFIEAAKQLNRKYKNIIMIAGSDRVPEFTRLLNTYNGKEFKFDTIEVISAGERDPDADDATGMSASKMRALAVKGNYTEFKRGLPSSVREIDGRRLMNDIREGMGLEPIKEQIVLVKDEIREKYFRGEIFNEGDIVESNGQEYTIVKRGSNHLLLKESSGQLVSKWIQDVQPKEEENMNEELTSKTLRPNDKIKIGRVIASMLGVENVESSSNPENLINMGLRKVRSKAMNPEALSMLQRMLNTATQMGIKFDTSLVPAKLKEGVIQPNGTDKIEVDTSAPVSGLTRFKDHRKVGSTLHDDDGDATDDQVRKMKVKTHFREEVSSSDDKEQKEVKKANLAAKHAREKEALSVKHDREKEQIQEISDLAHARYRDAARKTIKDVLPHTKGEYGDIAKNIVKKRMAGLAASGKAELRKKLAKEETEIEEAFKPGQSVRYETSKYSKDNKGVVVAHKGDTVTVKHKDAFGKEHHLDVHHSLVRKESLELQELSTDLLSRYKKKAGEESSAADKAGDFAKGHKRFKGILKATNKQFANDMKKYQKEETKLEEDICPECEEQPCVCETTIQPTMKPVDPFFESAVDVTEYEEKWEEHIFADEEPSEEELDHFMNHLTDDEIYDLYDEDELAVVDDESGEELPEDEEEKELDEETLMEVLSRAERMKAKFRIRRTKAKRQRATKIALKRYSNTATANKRARRLAIRMIKKRLLRGQDPKKVSVGEKERIERIIQKRKDLIKRISIKMVPRVRKIEKARLSHGTYTKGASPSVF